MFNKLYSLSLSLSKEKPEYYSLTLYDPGGGFKSPPSDFLLSAFNFGAA